MGRRTASNSVNLFLFSVPTTGIVVAPFSAVATQPTVRVLIALFLLLLVLAFVPHFIGISEDSGALRSEVLVLILDKLDMRATRSVVRATTPEYDLKTNLNSVEFPLYFRSLPSFNVFPDTATVRPDPPQTLPSRYTDQNNKPGSATMRNEMNCARMTRAFFLSHCGVRVMCVTQQWSHHKQRKQCATAHDSATARRTTLHRSEEGRSTSVSLWTKQTDKFSILRGSQNKPLVHEFTHAHA